MDSRLNQMKRKKEMDMLLPVPKHKDLAGKMPRLYGVSSYSSPYTGHGTFKNYLFKFLNGVLL